MAGILQIELRPARQDSPDAVGGIARTQAVHPGRPVADLKVVAADEVVRAARPVVSGGRAPTVINGDDRPALLVKALVRYSRSTASGFLQATSSDWICLIRRLA